MCVSGTIQTTCTFLECVYGKLILVAISHLRVAVTNPIITIVIIIVSIVLCCALLCGVVLCRDKHWTSLSVTYPLSGWWGLDCGL